MRRPRTDHDVELALTAWMQQAAPPRPPARLLEGTFIRTMRARQLRSFPWTGRVRGGPSGRMAMLPVAWTVVVVIGVLLAAAMAVGLVGGQGLMGPALASPSPTPEPVATPTAAASRPAAILVAPEARIPVRGPIAMVASGPALWVLASGRLDRIDPGTNAVAGSVTIGATSDLYNGLAANAAGLWATDAATAVLDRVDPATRRLVAAIPVGSSPKGVLATADAIWVADVHGGSVLPVDPATNRVGTAITVGPTGASGPNWLTSGLGSLWVGVPNNGSIVRIDAGTNRVEATIESPDGATPCGGIAVGTGAVWIPSCSSTNLMTRIDPATNAVVTTVDMGGYGYNPTLINDRPWISVDPGTDDAGFLARIDPATNSIDRALIAGPSFGGGGDIVVAAGSVWVVDGYHDAVLRLPLAPFGP